MTDADIILVKSAAHPSDDSSAAGGAATTTQITNGAVGEWMPRLVAKAAGTLDTDAEQQWQTAYGKNQHASSNLLTGGFYVDNLLVIPAASGLLKAVSSSASDDSGKRLKAWEEVAGILDTDTLAMNGVTQVSGIKTTPRAFRCGIFDASTGLLTTAVGVVEISVGSEVIGHIPAGESWATSEFRFAAAASTGDVSALTNRRTAPGGVTWSRPNTPASRLYVRADSGNSTLGFGERQAIYCEETLQPGMEPATPIKLCFKIYGDDDGA